MNRRKLLCHLILVSVLSLLGAACRGLPRDPQGTLQRVRGGSLRVGLVEHPPWVVRTGGEPAGAEVELVRRFARELGATPEWFWGGEQQHMEALKHFELELAIGGFTDQTPWSTEVGLTGPYFEERLGVGVPTGMQPPQEIKGLQVATKKGEALAAYLEKKGAVPVGVDDLSQVNGPVAAGLISFEIVKDGFASLHNSIAQLMNKRPSDVESKEKDPIPDKVQQELEGLDWVAGARVRLREDGDVLTGEAFVVPRDGHDLLTKLNEATEVANSVDWRLHDINIVAVRSLD